VLKPLDALVVNENVERLLLSVPKTAWLRGEAIVFTVVSMYEQSGGRALAGGGRRVPAVERSLSVDAHTGFRGAPKPVSPWVRKPVMLMMELNGKGLSGRRDVCAEKLMRLHACVAIGLNVLK